MLMKIVKFIDENSELNATHSCNGRKYYMYDFAICKYGFGNEKRKLRQLALLYAVRELGVQKAINRIILLICLTSI